jgi:hypothetical protein
VLVKPEELVGELAHLALERARVANLVQVKVVKQSQNDARVQQSFLRIEYRPKAGGAEFEENVQNYYEAENRTKTISEKAGKCTLP